MIPRHSPLRLYYQYRNAILLYREGWISLGWKLINLRQVGLRLIAYVLLARPLRPYLHMIAVGIVHGCRASVGPLRPPPLETSVRPDPVMFRCRGGAKCAGGR